MISKSQSLFFALTLFITGIPSVAQPDTSGPTPERVVALGGSITEIVYALGEGHRLVGVDASGIYPPAAQALPQLGYFRQISAEGVLSLNPDLVLALDEAGPPSSMVQLQAVGIPVKVIPSDESVEGARQKIRTIARALNREEQGETLIKNMEADLKAIARSTPQSPPRVMFIYARGSGTLNVSGADTAADAMIKLAGAENAITGYNGYRPLTAEAAVAAAPDVILVLDRGLADLEGRTGLLELPGIALTPAGQSGNIVSMDDTLFLSFGPRLGLAVQELHTLLFADAQ